MSEFSIVGGGIAGLVVARRLAIAGADVTLFEATGRLGGTVASHTVGGIVLDAGAESFALRGGTVEALATELSLGADIVAPRPGPAWLYQSSGRAVPLPATSLLGIPADPLAPDVVAVIGMDAAARAAALDGAPLNSAPLNGAPLEVLAADASLGALVRERMGAGVLDGLVAPVVRGVHSISPDDLAVDRAHPGLREALAATGSLTAAVGRIRAAAPPGSAIGGLRGGIHRLVTALSDDLDRLGVTVNLNHRVSDVASLAGTVIVAAPGVAASAPPGREITLVTLVVDQPELALAPRGSGLLVDRGAPVSARALTHATAKWEWLRTAAADLEVLRLSFDAPPADAVDTARRDAEVLLGVSLPRVVDTAVVTWTRPAPETATGNVLLVGETVAGSGLAGIVAHAERTAATLWA
ncbi:protoporphyrinogen/coproporphyrinogen oxidase (plasmid) [Coraliomargarita sp. W4R53]